MLKAKFSWSKLSSFASQSFLNLAGKVRRTDILAILRRHQLSMAIASVVASATFSCYCVNRATRNHQRLKSTVGQCDSVKAMQMEKPLEELYNVRVERRVSSQRLAELGVSRWSVWKTGKCKLPWDWQVDQLVYIEEGEVRVVPEGSQRYMSFTTGDLVRYPKWFEADLFFNGPYEERYSFRAYGDDY